VLGLGSGLDGVLDQGYRKLASTVSGELKRTVDALAAAARAAMQSAIPPWLAQEIEADRARMQTLVDMAAGHAARADRTQRDLAAAPRDARALAAQVEAMRDEQAREREALTAQLESLRGEQASERARLTDELANTRAELARITAALAEAPKSEALMRAELTQSQRDLNDERASIAKLTEALETARREADGHQIRFDSARHHLERFALEIEEARAALAAREDYSAKLASEVDGLACARPTSSASATRCAASATTPCARSSGTKREHEKTSVERESTLLRATAELEAAVEERDKRIVAVSEEADRMADAITEAAVRSAGLEEQLEMRTADLAALQIRFDDVVTRLRALESKSLVRAARWLGGDKPAREGSAAEASSVVDRAAAHARALQDRLERTEAREPALQQVGADERGEPEPVRADVQRARARAERERHEDEEARGDADHALGGHGRAPSGKTTVAAEDSADPRCTA
jgi:chromosome segregation ATPase